MNRKLKIKSYHYIVTVVAIVAVILINSITGIISSKLPLKIDLTENEVFKLSNETITVLQNVDKDINIYYFVTKGREDANVRQTIDMYKGYSDKIHFEQIDPAQDPAFTKSIALDLTDNSIVVKRGNRQKTIDYTSMTDYTFQQQGIISFQLESKLTAAIDYVLKDKDTNVVFTSGHEEIGMSIMKDTLDTENATVSEVDLKTANIPENTAILYIIGPKRDFSSEELQKIDAYVKGGGNLNVSIDYGNELPLLTQFMDEYYGIKFDNNIIMETDMSKILANNPYLLIPSPGEHEITSPFLQKKLSVIIPYSRSITVTEKLGSEASPLFVTSETAVATAPTENTDAVENSESPKQYTLAAAVRIPHANNKWSKIIASGTSIYAVPEMMQEKSIANADFVRNSYDFLRDSTISDTSITPKNVHVNSLILSQEQIYTYMAVYGLLPPLIILGYGLYTWIKRRRL